MPEYSDICLKDEHFNLSQHLSEIFLYNYAFHYINNIYYLIFFPVVRFLLLYDLLTSYNMVLMFYQIIYSKE